MNWTGGSILGQAMIATGGVLNILGNNEHPLGSTAVLNNAGTITHSGDGGLAFVSSQFGPFATLNNLAGGVYDVQSDADFPARIYVGGQFNNAGTFRKSGGTASSDFGGVNFINTGTVDLRSGTMSFGSAFSQTAGSLILNGGIISPSNVLVAGGTLIVNQSQSNITATIGPTASAIFNVTATVSALSLEGGTAIVMPSGNKVLTVSNLTITNGGILDLNDNDLILDYSGSSQLAAIQALINAARAGGSWTGTGITSTSAKNRNPKNTTLGAIEASQFKTIYGAGATFDGQSIDSTAVLVKYTYYGDTDFNGVVDFDDYSRTDSGFNLGRSGWLNGDFDGNGHVDFDDYSLIDLAFNTQGPALRPVRFSAAPKPLHKLGTRGGTAQA